MCILLLLKLEPHLLFPGSFANGHLNGSGAKAGLFAGSCKSDRTQHAVQSKDYSHEYSTEGPVRKR